MDASENEQPGGGLLSRRQAIGIGLASLILAALRAPGQTLSASSPLLPSEGGYAPETETAALYPDDVVLNGPFGDALNAGIRRLAISPYTIKWLRSDISFEESRPFTNFSGDVSGRFIEVASLTSGPAKESPAPLAEVLATVANYQKSDGHFGVDVNWNDPHDVLTRGTPELWGNARMLVGLTTAYEQYHDSQILDSARKLGDFYVSTADILCDPENQKKYKDAVGYASGFDVCYFPAIESLVRLYWLTRDKRYLKTAQRMAPLFYTWDRLPFPHTHGNLCAQYGLILLSEATGDRSYLAHVEQKWKDVVKGGYVCATGGVGENFTLQSKRDEGCAQADWLRVNLRLWAHTRNTNYLNMADRAIHNEYLANQFPDGGFGHRFLESDETGVYALGKPSQEATWCCVFHGTLGLHLLKSYLAVGADDGIYLNFPVDFSQTLTASNQPWKLTVTPLKPAPSSALVVAVHLEPSETSTMKGSRLFVRVPDWANSVKITDGTGKDIPNSPINGQLLGTRPLTGTNDLIVSFQKHLRVEDRHFQPVKLSPQNSTFLQGVVIRDGPHVLFANYPAGKATLLGRLDQQGDLQLPRDQEGRFTVGLLPNGTKTEPQAQRCRGDLGPV
jgi:DUF1680 family protein